MAAKLMQALQYSSYGGGVSGLKVILIHDQFLIFWITESDSIQLLVLKQHVEVPVPTPKTNEVLLKLEATSINPVDWKIQSGALRAIFLPRKFPHIPCITHSYTFYFTYAS